jgi:hypothetical protein
MVFAVVWYRRVRPPLRVRRKAGHVQTTHRGHRTRQ